MFDITILDEATERPLQPLEKASPTAAAEPKKVKPICEVARIELFALILFLTIAVVGVVSCFAELSQLLDNDAVGWVVRKATGGV